MSKRNHTPPAYVPSKKVYLSIIHWNYAIIALAIGVFIFTCLKLDLAQDDAYISFRYAANYLSGHGLVYNYAERVEGYTNFLWVMLLALFKGVFGADFLFFSRVAGVLSGSAIFYLLYILLKHNFEKVPPALYISLAAMLLCNLSLPYWSIASLETSAFAIIALAAVVAEYRLPRLTPALLIIATLLRPEGVIVFVAILIDRIITVRKPQWQFILVYIIPLLPLVIFKFIYFGSLFPNPFYAKSGVGFEYIRSGLEYLWNFTYTIGVFGIVFLVPLLAIKRLWNKYSLLYLFILVYTAYIVWVGGDVLKVYRFFVPVVPVLYFLFVVSLVELISLIRFKRQQVYGTVFILAAIFSIVSYSRSSKYVWDCRNAEIALVNDMHYITTMLKTYAGPDFSLATSTIGIVGYQLLGHRVIDMLGLTDTYIARNPENVKGIVSSWKERRFNNCYLLEQQPDFILFSTGQKPSAPAERALMLHSEFRHNYSMLSFLRSNQPYEVVWWRKGMVNVSRDVVSSEVEFVNKWCDGIVRLRQSPDVALADFREARRRLGEDYFLLSFAIGKCFLLMDKVDSGRVYLNQALVLDSLHWETRKLLVEVAQVTGDTALALHHLRFLKRYFPWNFK